MPEVNFKFISVSGMVVLVALNTQEDNTQQHCGPHEHDGFGAVTRQSMHGAQW
jgi:hypothetical protein